ncbi:MAG: Asp-tRNA(Asn)/Glu-tRNA(Gln) amidotransferase subunit GatB [Candidatus Acidiferrales bacterium]
MTPSASRTAASTAERAGQLSAEVRARYESVIGLEVHVQLATATKAFCACSTRFGDPPNTNVCPVCLGLPGALPVLNRRALELAIKAALALHGDVQKHSRFARKNYFYPDLPKGYQISQYELPLATGGWLEIDFGGEKKRIGVTRLHMEDDAAKNLHEGFADAAQYSHIDFNRCGVPLIEIVSEPDLRSPEEAYAYLTNLKQALEYTAVSDCNMEAGSLRCDANVSVRLRGAQKFGTKVEVKNLNSFRYLQHALEYEIERQIGVLESGGTVSQETRLWNVAAGRTEPMRSKEFAHDYRYFPEPDLLPVEVTSQRKSAILAEMPELPDAKRARFLNEYGISAYDAGVLTATAALANYFEAAIRAGAGPKSAANWIQTDLLRRLNDSSKEISQSPVSAEALADLLRRIEQNEITGVIGKRVLAKMFESGKSAAEVIASEGLSPISDTESVEKLCRDVIAKNAANVEKYRAGNEGVFQFLVGQVMKETKGRANPQTVNEILGRLLRQK